MSKKIPFFGIQMSLIWKEWHFSCTKYNFIQECGIRPLNKLIEKLRVTNIHFCMIISNLHNFFCTICLNLLLKRWKRTTNAFQLKLEIVLISRFYWFLNYVGIGKRPSFLEWIYFFINFADGNNLWTFIASFKSLIYPLSPHAW